MRPSPIWSTSVRAVQQALTWHTAPNSVYRNRLRAPSATWHMALEPARGVRPMEQPCMLAWSSMWLVSEAPYKSINLVRGAHRAAVVLVVMVPRVIEINAAIAVPNPNPVIKFLDPWRPLFLTHNTHPNFPQQVLGEKVWVKYEKIWY